MEGIDFGMTVTESGTISNNDNKLSNIEAEITNKNIDTVNFETPVSAPASEAPNIENINPVYGTEEVRTIQNSSENALIDENIDSGIFPSETILAEATQENALSVEEVIKALESESDTEKPTDEASQNLPVAVIDNINDSQELADEVGVSDVFDEYGREILEPVFENKLRMSKNGVKLAYSKIKNTILSYKNVKQRFSLNFENFKFGAKLLFRIEAGEDSILLFCAIDPETLDKEQFSHTQARGAEYKETPSKLIVKKEREKKGDISSLERALNLISKIMETEGVPKLKVYVPVAYSERYPLNPTAVLRGKETEPPVEGYYDNEEYDPIDDEISRNIIVELMGPDHNIEAKKGKARLDAMRQQATTIKGAVAMTEPIIYFYDSAVNSDNTNAFVNVQQVFNDKFMGKIIPQQFFAIAESSERITELNLLTLKQLANDCNENPKVLFVTKISCRLLAKKTNFQKLLKAVETQNRNLILALDCALLEVLGQAGLDAVNALKQHEINIMIDDTENAGLKILTEYPIHYLRFDARYYKEENKASVAHLDMLTGYAKVQGIITASNYVDNTKMARFLQTHGVEIIQGPVVCEPKRVIYNAIKEVKKLPTFNK